MTNWRAKLKSLAFQSQAESKVQMADLTCDVIKKVAPFVLSKLWILVADWSMRWSPDTFLIKLQLYAGLQKIKQSIWILREIFHFWGRFFISETNFSYLYQPYCIAPNLDGHCTLDQGYWSPAAVVINRHLENSSHDMCPCYILHWELTT